MMNKLFCILFFFSATTAYSAHTSTISVEGRISKVDRENVSLLVDGKEVVVPRNSIPAYYSVSYMTKVTAYLPAKDLKRSPAQKK